MELYTRTSYELTEKLTERYSTSFSMASQLFDSSIRPHIYAIYGMVRIGDEIVDAYRQSDAAERLRDYREQVRTAIESGFSTNPIIHAFACTARHFAIGTELVDPFFESMATDLTAKSFTKNEYARYIYGSAEVVGLMCLKVFTDGDSEEYAKLKDAACALGAAYQKVNFLRDMRADYDELGRVYFPGVHFESFNDKAKRQIVDELRKDFARAEKGISKLPIKARKAVNASYLYYYALLQKLERTPVDIIRAKRIRISNAQKTLLYARVRFGR